MSHPGSLDRTALLPFVELRRGTTEARRIYALRQDLLRSQQSGHELLVDRLFCADWVNVVAFDDDDRIVFVRQWRFGTESFSLEVPAGVLHPGEDPVAGGLRELAEETGYAPVDGSAVRLLGAVRPNPAFMDNRSYVVLVPRARRVSEPHWDESEEIEILTIPRAEVAGLVGSSTMAAGRGETPHAGQLDSALSLVALHLALHNDGS